MTRPHDTFGQRLHDARAAQGWSQGEICAQLNLADTKSYGRWERDEGRPNRLIYTRLLTLLPQLEAEEPDWAHGWAASPAPSIVPLRPAAPAPTFAGAPSRAPVPGPLSTTAPSPEWYALARESAIAAMPAHDAVTDRLETTLAARQQIVREAAQRIGSLDVKLAADYRRLLATQRETLKEAEAAARAQMSACADTERLLHEVEARLQLRPVTGQVLIRRAPQGYAINLDSTRSRAFLWLEEQSQARSVKEIAAALGQPVRRVHNILYGYKSVSQRGRKPRGVAYADRDADGRWALTHAGREYARFLRGDVAAAGLAWDHPQAQGVPIRGVLALVHEVVRAAGVSLSLEEIARRVQITRPDASVDRVRMGLSDLKLRGVVEKTGWGAAALYALGKVRQA